MSDGLVSAWAPDIVGWTALGQPVWSKAHEPPDSRPRRQAAPKPKGGDTKRAKIEPGEHGVWGRTSALTRRDVSCIDKGLHPSGERILGGGKTCRHCKHAVLRSDCGNRASCEATKHQIRPGWPACSRWRAKDA